MAGSGGVSRLVTAAGRGSSGSVSWVPFNGGDNGRTSGNASSLAQTTSSTCFAAAIVTLWFISGSDELLLEDA